MSEASETKGRCRMEMDSLDGGRASHILADALDRLAADVAEVKEAVCDGSVAAERDRFLAGMGAAIRERDEARANVKKLVAVRTGEIYERDAAIRERDEARAEAERLRSKAVLEVLAANLAPPPHPVGAADPHAAWRQAIIDRDLAIKRCDEAIRGCDAAYSERRKAKAEAEKFQQAVGLAFTVVGDMVIDVEDPVGMMQRVVAEVERLRAELAARPAESIQTAPEPDYYLVTNERGVPIHVCRLDPGVGWDGCTITALYAHPQLPAQEAAGWLTDRERHVLSSMLSERPCDWSLHWADDIQPAFRAILARAGSPPVVEVPALKFLGSMTGREQGIALAYRDALDAAGIPWKEKEVPRE